MTRHAAVTKKPSKKILILGVGNILLRDEGLGVKTVALFKKTYALPKNIACIDGGTAGLGLISVFKGVTRAIIVDAVRAGGKPGDIYIFNSENITSKTKPVSSTHGVGIAELIAMLKFQGISPSITIIGMEPKDISAGLEVTPEVEKNLFKILETIAEKLAGFGIRLKRSVKRA